MRKLILSVMAVLFITTSAWALDTAQIKLYIEKHFQITKKLRAIKIIQGYKKVAVNQIKTNYNYPAMLAELKTIQDLYNPQIESLNVEYNTLVGELEGQ